MKANNVISVTWNSLVLLFHKFCKITLLLLSKERKKRVKPGGCAHGQTKLNDLSLLAPKSLIHQIGQKKNPRPHLLTFGYY